MTDLTLPLLLLMALALTAWGIRCYRAYWHTETPPRIDRRLADDEMALTGDDYRVHVMPYFRKRAGHEEIVREVCGLD
jgi:hypothetical protein